MSDILDSEQVGDLKVIVRYDDRSSFHPRRDWDNATKLALTHPRFDLPDEAFVPWDRIDSWSDLETYLIEAEDAVYVFPVVMLEHGAVAFRIGRSFASDPDGWDTSIVGAVCITRQEIADFERYGDWKTDAEWALQLAKSELQTYEDWVNGCVYRYTVETDTGEVLDSCGGFVGDYNDCINEGMASAEHLWRERVIKQAQTQAIIS